MDSHSQIYLPRLTKINKILIIIACSIFILDFILEKTATLSIGSMFGLSAQSFMQGHIYTILVYPFFSHSILEVILNSLMLWLMGSEFEESWGSKRYLNFIVSVVVGGGLLFLAVSMIFFKSSPVYSFPLIGLSGIVSSLCMAYAIIFPDRIFSFMMIIPIKARYFCLILIALSLYQGFSGPLGVGAWGQLGAIASAYLFMYLVSNRNFKILSSKVTNDAEEIGEKE